MSDSELVHVKDDGRVRTIRFNRPDKLNAINAATIDALHEAYSAAAGDDMVHVVLMTGTGRAFTTGADLSDMKSQNEGEVDSFPEWALERFDQLQALLEAYPKPLVAAVNGLTVGLGFTMLGYCDFTFVAESARLRTPLQLGLSPEASSSYTFPLRMGWASAARALMLGDWFTAQDLVASGLAPEVVPDMPTAPRSPRSARSRRRALPPSSARRPMSPRSRPSPRARANRQEGARNGRSALPGPLYAADAGQRHSQPIWPGLEGGRRYQEQRARHPLRQPARGAPCLLRGNDGGDHPPALHPRGAVDDYLYIIEDAGATTLVYDPASYVAQAAELKKRRPQLRLPALPSASTSSTPTASPHARA